MKKLFLSLLCLGSLAAQAQITLTGSSYTQDFNGIGGGLPAGWSVWTAATATALGTDVSTTKYTAMPTRWNLTSGGFRNSASANGVPFYASLDSAAQSASPDRALSVRQVGNTSSTFPGSDPGAAFVLMIDNTVGLAGFNLSFDLQSLDSTSGRVTTWSVDYGIGTAPSSFTTVATSGTATTGGNTFANNTVTASFGSALDGLSGPVYIRIVILSATTGSGNRTTTGIDDYTLTWSGAGAPSLRPIATSFSPAPGAVGVSVATTSLDITFNKAVQKGTGNITLRNQTDGTSQVFDVTTPAVTVSGAAATVSGAVLALGKTYNVFIDSTCFDTAGYRYLGIYDSTSWRFSTPAAPPPPPPPAPTFTSLYEQFDSSCGAGLTLPFGWSRYSVTDSFRQWRCNPSTAANESMVMNGFDAGAGAAVANEDWLITPSLYLPGPGVPYFAARMRYRRIGPDLQVLASNNYTGGDPNLATWTDLGFSFSAADSNKFVTRDASLAAFMADTMHIAFKYTSNTGVDQAKQWDVDSAIVYYFTIGMERQTVAGDGLSLTVLGRATGEAIHLRYSVPTADPYTFEVYDVAGRLAAKRVTISAKGNARIVLEPGVLQPGMYFIRLSGREGTAVVKVWVE